MQYTREQKEKIISGFLELCKDIGYTDEDYPLLVQVVEGIPIRITKIFKKGGSQVIRLNIPYNLTKTTQNTTME